MSDLIRVQRDGFIADVTLNRPEKLNAMTKSMWRDLGSAIGALSAEDQLRCIVLRGAGDKSFSPGNDITEFENERSNVDQGPRLWRRHDPHNGGISQLSDPDAGLDPGRVRRRRT